MTRSSPRAVPVLTYHSIDNSGSVISMHPARFRDQMQLLASRGYLAVTASELLDLWEQGGTIPVRTVVITFDDAMENVATAALPVMAALGFRATVFAVSGKVGQFNDWPGQATGIPRLPLLPKEGLADLAAAGFEVGAHTVSHRRLTRLSQPEAESEIVNGKQELEDTLGMAVRCFAYPFGDVNAAVHTVAAAHFRASFGTRLALTTARDDRHELPRVDMYYFRNLVTFGQLESPMGRWYLGARAAARRVRATLTL